MCYEEPSLAALQKTGVVCLDGKNKVLLIEEKPQNPKSRWAVPSFYIYRKEDLPLIRDTIAQGCPYDAPDNLAHYLTTHTTLHAWPIPSKCLDIGDVEAYTIVKKRFE